MARKKAAKKRKSKKAPAKKAAKRGLVSKGKSKGACKKAPGVKRGTRIRGMTPAGKKALRSYWKRAKRATR